MKSFFYILWIVLKRVWSHWRLELNLFLTFVVAASIVAAIPLFTNGSLQYSLGKALESYEEINNIPAEVFRFSYARKSDILNLEKYTRVNGYLERAVPSDLGGAVKRYQHGGRLANYFFRSTSRLNLFGRIQFLTNFEDMVNVTTGRLPENSDPDVFFEVIVSEECLHQFELVIGKDYPFKYTLKANPQAGRMADEPVSLNLRVIGTFTIKEEYLGSPEWSTDYFESSFFLNREAFFRLAELDGLDIDSFVWHWYLDELDLAAKDLYPFFRNLTTLETSAGQILPGISLEVSPRAVLEEFYNKSLLLRTLLFSLSLPVLGIVLYYIILAVQLMVNRRRTEIALLQSRGAGRLQICSSYIIEWGILGLLAVAIAPFIGSFISLVLGASRGFLSFVDREPLKIRITGEPFIFSGVLILLTILATLVPVFIAAGQSIVNYKQEVSRKKHKALWQRFPTELILIGLSLYGYYNLRVQAAGGGLSDNVIIEPGLFLLPVLMIIGVVLLVIRLLPYLFRLLDRLTQKNSQVHWDMTFKLLARSPEQYNPLIFLVVITVAIGIFSSATARTMDLNFIDGEHYRYGTDVLLEERWEPLESEKGPGGTPGGEAQGLAVNNSIYEPPFFVHNELPGVKGAARILLLDNVGSRNTRLKSMKVMAFSPHEFYNTAWFREGLLEYPLYAYLNLLIQYPEGIILSRQAAESAGLNPGEQVSFILNGITVNFTLVATVKYWPTLYPAETPFGIANLEYLQSLLPITPYKIWLSMEEEGSLQEVVDELYKKGIYVLKAQNYRRLIVEGLRNPQRTGMYGILSTGFLVAAMVTIAGFLLYTLLSIKNRLLHFGVLRAIGLKVKHIMSMLSLELLFTVGTALLLGTLLGEGVSKLFLPLLRLNASSSGDVPPFRVVIDFWDKANIYLILGVAILLGIIGLRIIVSRLKINQAVKLGEDL